MAHIQLDARSSSAGKAQHSTVRLSVVGIAEVLAMTPFLAHVPKEALNEVAKAAFLRRYEPGEDIVVQGDYGHTMFVLLYGSVAITSETDQGQRLHLATLNKAGQYFGEVALLGRARRSATATSEGESALIELEKTKIEKLDKDVGEILDRIEKASAERSIRTFLTNHRYFADLDPNDAASLAGLGELQVHERNARAFEEGEPVDRILVVKKGVGKLVQLREASETVVSYFNAGDVIGLKAPARWPATLVSMGYMEVIAFPVGPFREMERRNPVLFEKFHKDQLDKLQSQSRIGKSETVAIFIDNIFAEGAHEGLSLLTIDLNLCIRCGNCTRSCQARHGHAKMTRRGKKLVRRQKLEEAGSYQNILIPASCRHCVNPECMIGCPTGAIHRTSEGEVDIHDFCIGCASCANRCPWNNITMVPTPGRIVDGAEMKQIASKCNLCSGYEYSNCVNNCPTGAILRIEPTSYYEELKAVIGDTSQEAVGVGTRTRKGTDWSRLLIPAAALLILLAMGATYALAPSPYSPWSTSGMVLGVGALLSMTAAVALALRRRLNRLRVQFGQFKVWARVHFWIGALSFAAVLLHSGFSPGGLVTSMLLLFTVVAFVTGVLGMLYYKWLPNVITRIEGESQVEEDLVEERGSITTRIEEVLEQESDAVKALAKAAAGKVGSTFGRYGGGYDSAKVQGKALEALSGRMGALEPGQQRALEQIVVDHCRLKEIEAALWTYRLRRAFMVLHIGIAAMLVTLVVVHVVSVLFFWT